MAFEHLQAVLAEVETLGQRFAEAGYRLFLVGGIVRDQWLDENLDASSDIDLTTNAMPAVIKDIVAPMADDMWSQGERFGTIGMRAGGRDYEITTHRAESYNSESRKPEVSFGDDIEVDLSRRDFTVNAMAIELPDGDLVDPFGGTADLGDLRLRTPLSAEVSFSDDPLRMLRAARFATKYGLAPDVQVVESATELRERLRIVAIERIGVEVRRLLDLNDPARGLGFLTDTGLLTEVLCFGDPTLQVGVHDRLAAAGEVVSRLGPEWRVRLAGIGLTVFDDPAGVEALCRRLRLSRDDERHIVGLAKGAVAIRSSADTSAPTVRRWATATTDRVGSIELAHATWPENEATGPFERAFDALSAVEDLDADELIDGDQIKRELGLAPGPDVGRAMAFLKEAYFDHGPLSADEQLSRLRTWWQKS